MENKYINRVKEIMKLRRTYVIEIENSMKDEVIIGAVMENIGTKLTELEKLGIEVEIYTLQPILEQYKKLKNE